MLVSRNGNILRYLNIHINRKKKLKGNGKFLQSISSITRTQISVIQFNPYP